jgi:predicted amidohydrolase
VIENAAYVLAPSKIGAAPGQPSNGRSMVIVPWGRSSPRPPDTVAIIRAELDLERVGALLSQVPVLANRRPHAYEPDRATPRA